MWLCVQSKTKTLLSSSMLSKSFKTELGSICVDAAAAAIASSIAVDACDAAGTLTICCSVLIGLEEELLEEEEFVGVLLKPLMAGIKLTVLFLTMMGMVGMLGMLGRPIPIPGAMASTVMINTVVKLKKSIAIFKEKVILIIDEKIKR